MASTKFSILGRAVWSVGKFVAPRAYKRWDEQHGQSRKRKRRR